MQRTALNRYTRLKAKTPLKSKVGLKSRKRLKPVSVKTAARNRKWRAIVEDRALYLVEKYGFLICEYSGETITTLASVPNDLDDGWGHHIDGDRANCFGSNCYIVKYKYHSLITDKNIEVKQEDFQGRK